MLGHMFGGCHVKPDYYINCKYSGAVVIFDHVICALQPGRVCAWKRGVARDFHEISRMSIQ